MDHNEALAALEEVVQLLRQGDPHVTAELRKLAREGDMDARRAVELLERRAVAFPATVLVVITGRPLQ